MKNQRKSSIIHFGPRSNISSRLKMTHVSRVRKSRKHVSRFVSPRMMKIDEEIKRSLNMMRAVGATNHAFVPQRAEQSIPKIGNIMQSRTITSEHLTPLTKNAGKSNHSPAMSQHMNQARTSKIDSHSKYSRTLGNFDKISTPSHSNGTLRPLELSCKSKMKQVPENSSSSIKRSYSQANHLKAMPRLVHNMKIRSNLDKGATKWHNESGLNGCIGGTKDKNMRCEPLPEPKIPGDIDLNMPRKWRKYIETIDGVDDIGDQCHLSHEDNGCVGGTKDMNMRCEPLPEPKIPGDIDLNMTKKRRKYIETKDDIGDHGRPSDKDDSTRLPSHHVSLKDCHAKVWTSFVSTCVAQQHDCCSKPIDESAWSGILKIDNKEYVSLAGHLSTKSGEKVWNLSKLLQRVVEVTKVCRSHVWPKRWETSRPTSDNIGLYFFPYKMRPDKYHDQLIKEVMENDLALRAAIDEAEILIFPSSLLPEQYQMFQSKHYLWGVFRPSVVEGKQGDELRHVDNTTEAVATNATSSVPTDATVAPTNAGAIPADEALTMPTKAHTGPTSQCRIDLSKGALPDRVVSFVVRQTPRVEQLIQEMERDGALIVAMHGEMLAGDGSLGRRHGDHNAASRSSA